MDQELFNVSIVSLPLNFTILLHPDSMKSLGIEENGYALMKGVNDQITVVKVIKDSECPRTTTKITHSVQLTLAASPGDCVPILPFSGEDQCEAIQVAPLFEKNSSSNDSEDYTSAVKHFFTSDQRPISVDSIFTLLINSEQRAFKILKCLPCDRSFSYSSTKIYFANEPGPLLPQPSIPKHLSTLVLDKSLVNFVKNNIYFPVNRQSILHSLNFPTSIGIVIEGPSGSGRTSLLSAISNTVNIPSIYCASKRLKKLSVSDFVEKLNQIFGFTAEKPQCLIMFDDLDHVFSSFKETKITSERCKLATFINLLDFVMQRPGIVVIATVTSCSAMESTLFRDGRFGQQIHLRNPTIEQRKEMVRLFTAGMKIDDDDLDEIVRKIGGNDEDSTVSSKELERICRVAVASLIEEVTGTQGSDVVDSLAVYALNTKMKAMHFGVTSRISKQSSRSLHSSSRSRFGGDDDGERRRRHRRHRRHRHHHDDDDDEDDENNENDEEEDDEDENRSRHHRRHRRHRRDRSSSSSRRSRRSHRRHREPESEDDEEDEDDDSRRTSPRRQREPESEDEEEDEEVQNNSRRNRNRSERGQSSRKKQKDSESDDDDTFTARKAKVPKRKDDNSEDDDNKSKPKRTNQRNQEDSNSENEDPFSKIGMKGKKPAVDKDSDDQNDSRKRRPFPERMNKNNEDDDQRQFPSSKNSKVTRSPRGRKTVFNDINDDDDDDDD